MAIISSYPQTEDYYGNVNTIGPRGVYDEAKRFQGVNYCNVSHYKN
jgi:hypothetical protein